MLAVGGGSALCAAKAVAIRLRNPAPLDALRGHRAAAGAAGAEHRGADDRGIGQRGLERRRAARRRAATRHLVIRGRGYEPRVALLDGELLRDAAAARR